MEYPCNCPDMKYMMDNNDVFRKEDTHWILVWVELDKTDKGTNIERYGIKFHNCMFCGKKIKG